MPNQTRGCPFFSTRELRACARASYKYDVGNGIRYFVTTLLCFFATLANTELLLVL